MNRIFHAKVTFCRGLVLIILTAATLFTLWRQWPLVALPAMLLLLWWIERLIHTTYTLTPDQQLLIDKGRFSHTCIIYLADVRHLQRSQAMQKRHLSLWGGIQITCNDGRRFTLHPQHEEECLAELQRRCQQIDNPR